MTHPDIYLPLALQTLANAPVTNDLAFLALTSKIEFPVRDRLGFTLATMRSQYGALVAREWKERVDLAVLSTTGDAEALIEVKSMYSFDIFNRSAEAVFQRAIQEDRLKLARVVRKHRLQHAASYVLALVTHPQSAPTQQHQGIVKYRNQIERLGEKSSSQVSEQIVDSFGTGSLASGHIPCGMWFETPVEVHYALHRVKTDA